MYYFSTRLKNGGGGNGQILKMSKFQEHSSDKFKGFKSFVQTLHLIHNVTYNSDTNHYNFII